MELVLAGLAALAAGVVNAIAGGGSLITFPTLVAIGIPPVIANVTNTVALCPGYLGATWAQRRDLRGQGGRIALLVPLAAVGGITGALLLLHSSERAFTQLVPFLLAFATLLVAIQSRLRARLGTHARSQLLVAVPMALCAVYGGYFGAGLGVMTLAVLGSVLADSLTRLNALKQLLSLTINVIAAGVFVVRAPVEWTSCGVMAGAALVGGVVGGKLAARVPAHVLRGGVVVLGGVLAAVYFWKYWAA